jgi:methylenetetrahydrofolate reductase (NADPH)
VHDGGDRARFEVLPLDSTVEEAERLPLRLQLTVTCSSKHGPDRTLEVAGRLRALGHSVTPHIAARMVRDEAHLDAVLAAIADADLDGMFLIGGDGKQQGPYASAAELLPLIADHPRRPETIGIAGYPEGHPLISDEALDAALQEKSHLADYVTTQMCFDPEAVRSWVVRQREMGLSLPVMAGMPGKVRRHRLVEMSARIGVGQSVSFLRKQRGIRRLLSRGSTVDRLHDALAPALTDRNLRVVGFHFFTFNQLVDTWEWYRRRDGVRPSQARDPAALDIYHAHHEEIRA